MLGVSSCGTSRRASDSASLKHAPVNAGKSAPANVADALVAEAREWLGVPYVYGGKSRDGADCSGFLMTIYQDAAGINLPRTTTDQWMHCAPVDRDKAAVGDIMFFSSKRSGGKIAHVGMYVGNGRMIHASSSRGVVEDDLSLKYYTDHYLGTGRVPAIADATPVIHDAKQQLPEIVAPPVPQMPQLAATVHVDSLPALFRREEPRVIVAVTEQDTVVTTTNLPAIEVANAFAKATK